MVGTTAAATQEIESDSRRWNLILTDQRGHKLESADGDVISMSLSIETTSGELTIGDIITKNVNIEIRRGIDNDGTQFDYNSTINIGFGLRDAPGIIHMGTFQVKTATKAAERIRLNLKDLYIVELSDTYTPSSSLTYPAPVLTVMQDICSEYLPVHYFEPLYILDDTRPGEYIVAKDRAGSTLYVRSSTATRPNGNPITLTQQQVQQLSGKKVSEALSICAGLLGCMLVKGRDNSLECIRPSVVPYNIGPDRAGEPQFASEETTITQLACKVSDNSTLYYPPDEPNSGSVLYFENPFMEANRLSEIAQDYLELSFRPALIDHKLGDPRLDPLDIISYQSIYEKDAQGNLKTFSMPLMSFDYNFDGGLSCNLQSNALKEVNHNG